MIHPDPDPDEDHINKRLTERRSGILQPKNAMKPKKSNLYCNNCNIPDNLICCINCNDKLCNTCMYSTTICIKCNTNLKRSNKVSPNNTRKTEYIEAYIFKKYICCFLNRNKK